MKKWIRRIGIGIGTAAGLTLLLLIGLWSYLCTDHAHRRIQAVVNQAIPGTVSWQRGALSFFGGRAELKQITLRDPAENEVISLDRVFVNIAWTGLLRGALEVESATLEKPQVRLKVDEQGKLNLLSAFPPSPPEAEKAEPSSGGMPLNLVVRDFRLTGGQVEYEIAARGPDEAPQRAAVREIEVTAGDADLAGQSGRVALRLGGGEIDMAGIRTAFEAFRADVAMDNGRITPLTVKLDSDTAVLDISGDVASATDRPQLSLDLSLETALEKIRDTLQLTPELTGPVTVSLRATGEAANPDLTLTVHYGGGEVAGNRIDRLDLVCRLGDRVVRFEQFDLDSPLGKLNLTGEADLRKAFADGFLSPPGDLEAITWRAELRQTGTALDRLPIEGAGLGGRVTTRLSLEGEGITPEHMSAKAVLALLGEQVTVSDILSPVDIRLNAEAGLRENVAAVRQLELSAGEALRVGAEAEYALADRTISGHLSVSAPELDKALSLAGVQDVSGNIALDADLSGTVTQPVADLRLQGDQLGFQEITIGNLRLTAGLDEAGVVRISALNLENRGSEIEASGTVKAFDNGMALNPDLPADLSLKLSRVEAKDFLNKEMIGGRLDGLLTLKGKLMAPAATLSLSGKSLAFETTRIGDLDADIRFSNGRVTLAPVKLRNGRSGLELTGTATVLTPEGFRPLADPGFDLKLTSAGVFLNDFVETLKGRVRVSADISGSLKAPTAHLSLKGEKLAAGESRIGDVDADIRFADGVATLKTVEIRNNKSRLALSGTAKVLDPKTMKPLDDPAFDITLSDGLLFPDDFLDTLSGKLSLSARAKGSLRAPTARLSLKGEKLAAGETHIGDVDANIRFADGIATLKTVEIRNNKSRLALSGTATVLNPKTMKPLDDPSFDIVLSDGLLFPDDFLDTLSGKLSLSARAQGSLRAPTAQLSLKGEALKAGENRIGDVDADIRFADGTANLKQVRVRNGKSALNISGTAQVLDSQTGKPLKDPLLDLTLAGDQIRLRDFVEKMKGQLALKGRIRGSAARPEGTVSLTGKAIDLGVQKIDSIQLAARLDGERIFIDPLNLTLAPGQSLEATGWVHPLQQTYDLRVTSGDIALKQIGPVQDRFDSGTLHLSLAGAGRFDDPRLSGDLRLTGLRVNRKKLEDILLRVDLRDQVVRVSGDLGFDLSGQYHLRKGDFQASATFDKTDLTPYFRLADRKDLSGVVTGKIEASGNAAAPDRIRAVADMPRLEIFMKENELIRAKSFSATFQNREISVPGIRLALLKQGYIDLIGSGKLDGDLGFTARGHIPLKVARMFSPALQDITGDVRLSADISGPVSRPDILADVRVEKVGMTVPGLLQKLHDLSGQIRVTPQAVTLTDIRGGLDTGDFSLSGKIGLKDFQPTDILAKLSAHALPVTVPDTVELLLSTDLAFKGTPEKSAITGELMLLEGAYYKDVKLNLIQAIGQKKREMAPVAKGESPPFMKNVALDIAVKYRNPFTVDNNMALMALKPNLRIYGTLDQPLVSGRAVVDSGTITYQKKEFEVQKGVFDFLNPYKIEPTLDVAGEVAVRSWTISLNVSGTPDNLKFELTSDPEEADASILSLLTLGMTTEELIAKEGGSSVSTTQVLADMVASSLQSNLRDATGLDIVEVKYTEAAGDESEAGVAVTVGKELSRRVTVKYGVETRDGETVQRATTEYKFLENLLMSAFQDTQGNFGGELQFRLEFR